MRGTQADQSQIAENPSDLPVLQPDTRANWRRATYFDPRGHAVNRSGAAVNERWWPLDAVDKPVDPCLFAAGRLRAHQDWIRQRCGAGLAIASAFKVVQAAERVAT